MYNEHPIVIAFSIGENPSECIAIDIFDVLGNEWLNAAGRGALMM